MVRDSFETKRGVCVAFLFMFLLGFLILAELGTACLGIRGGASAAQAANSALHGLQQRYATLALLLLQTCIHSLLEVFKTTLHPHAFSSGRVVNAHLSLLKP